MGLNEGHIISRLRVLCLITVYMAVSIFGFTLRKGLLCKSQTPILAVTGKLGPMRFSKE